MKGARKVCTLLDRVTRGARVRGGVTTFLLGSQATSDRLLSRIYFEVASRDWGGFASQDDHLMPFIEALKALPPGRYERVLDLGTGAGGSADQLAEMFPDSTVIGVDRSRRMIGEARRRFTRSNLSFEHGDAVTTLWPSESFDLVTAHNFIPHPPQVRRLLSPSGVAIVSDTYQPVGAVSRHVWEVAGFELVARADVADGSFELYQAI